MTSETLGPPFVARLNHARNAEPISYADGQHVVLAVGRHTYFGDMEVTKYRPFARIEIGAFCSISKHVSLRTGGEHRVNIISGYSFEDIFPDSVDKILALDQRWDHVVRRGQGGITIGNDVWIGRHATILGGVTIGHGAVIGSNSVVAKDIPPYAIVVGNPARIIRTRFSPDKIDKLLAIGWWHWRMDVIERNLELIMSEDVDGLYAAARQQSAPSDRH